MKIMLKARTMAFLFALFLLRIPCANALEGDFISRRGHFCIFPSDLKLLIMIQDQGDTAAIERLIKGERCGEWKDGLTLFRMERMTLHLDDRREIEAIKVRLKGLEDGVWTLERWLEKKESSAEVIRKFEEERARKTREERSWPGGIKKGMEKYEIISILGEPTFTGVEIKNNTRRQVLKYPDKRLYLLFDENGVLVEIR